MQNAGTAPSFFRFHPQTATSPQADCLRTQSGYASCCRCRVPGKPSILALE